MFELIKIGQLYVERINFKIFNFKKTNLLSDKKELDRALPLDFKAPVFNN